MSDLTELQHQCKFFKWARDNCQVAKELMHSNGNGGLRTKKGASILKHAGSLKGIPDIFLPYPHGSYHGLFIELKKDKRSKISSEQSILLEKLTYLGYKATLAVGWEDARDILLEYLGKKA